MPGFSHTLFDTVIEASWQASVLAIVILLARLIRRNRLSPRWRCALWGLLVLRLAMPVLPESRFSIFNAMQRTTSAKIANANPTRAFVVYGDLPAPQQLPPVDTAKTQVSVQASSSGLSWKTMAMIVWLCGVLVLVLRMTFVNLRFAQRIKRADAARGLHLLAQVDACCHEIRMSRPRIVETDAMSGPAVFGVFRPTLLLPPKLAEQLSADELRFVLMHELMHIKRRDVLVGWIVWLFNAIHWFNPLLWLAAARFREDRELACDAAVIRRHDPASARGYGMTLVKLLQIFDARQSQVIGVAGLLENRAAVFARIECIARRTQNRFATSALFALLVVVIALLTLTAPLPQTLEAQSTQPASTLVTRAYDLDELAVLISDKQDFGWRPNVSTNERNPSISRTTVSSDERNSLIIQTIRDRIDPGSWRSQGGIQVRDKQLVIIQKPENHDQLLNLIRQKSIQITVETRFLIGKEMDDTWTQIVGADAKWTEKEGYSLWPQMLDDAQVKKLLQETQLKQDTTTMTAPRLTLFNEQNAHVRVSTETAYISAVNPIEGKNGEVAFDPTVSTADSGVSMNCRATVNSEAPQTVTLDLHPRLSRLFDLKPVPVTVKGQTAYIQIPTIAVAEFSETFEVPSDKSLLVRMLPTVTPPDPNVPTEPIFVLIRPKVIIPEKAP